MKLLLTSAGITNESIRTEFLRLLGKNIEESVISFVPTAGLFGSTDKKWFVDELLTFRNLSPAELRFIDFNLLPREEIVQMINNSDALVFSGGSASTILHAIDKKNLRDILQEFAQQKLYAGVSASSHIVCKDLALSNKKKIEQYQQVFGYKAEKGLAWLDFYIRSHFGEERFPDLTDEYMQEKANSLKTSIYGMDDQSAISVEGKKVQIISEGKSKIFNPNQTE